MSANSNHHLGILAAIAGAAFFSAKSILIKFAYRYGADAVTLLMLRMLISLPFFLAMAWYASRGKPKLTRHDWCWVLFLGVIGYYMSSFMDFQSLHYIGAGFGRMIMYLNPTFVLILGLLLFGRHISAKQAACTALCYLGIGLIFKEEFVHTLASTGDATGTWIGSGLVLAAALLYAVYLVYSAEVVKRLGALRLTGLASTVACVCALLQYAIVQGVVHEASITAHLGALQTPVWWLALILAVVSTVLPIYLTMLAMEKLGSGPAAQYSMLGPVVTLSLGVVLLDEPMTLLIGTGVVCVLVGTYWMSQKQKI